MRPTLFILLITTCLLSPVFLFAQTDNVGIGTTTPEASAALDIEATDKGLLIPRMTTAQRTAIASPATGLLVFDTDENSFFYFENADWRRLGLPTDGQLDEVLKSDASGQASWQPLFPSSFIPEPDPMLNGSLNIGSGTKAVAVQNSYAYVVDDMSDDLKVINVSNPTSPVLSGVLTIGTDPSGVAVQGDFAYVVDDGSEDLKVINISDPNMPPFISGSINIGPSPRAIAVQGNFAYVVDWATGNFMVVDVSNPASLSVSPSLIIGSAPSSVAVQGNFAYTLDAATGDFKVIDVSDPISLSISGSLTIGSNLTSLAVQGNFAYVVDAGSGSFFTIDISNPVAPSILVSASIGSAPSSIVVQGNLAYLVDTGTDDFKIIDISNPSIPTVIESLAIGTTPQSLAVNGNFAYVVDEDSDDLKIINLGTTALGIGINGEPTAFTEADGDPTNELISGGTLNGNNLEITDAGGTTTVDLSALSPTETDPQVGANTTNYLPKWDGSALVQSTSIFEDGSGKVGIGTDTPAGQLDVAGTLRTESLSMPIGAADDYVLKSDASGQASWQPLFPPSFIPEPDPTLSGSLAIGSAPSSVAVQGSYAYVVDFGSVDLKVIDVSDPSIPALSGSLAIGSSPRSVAVQGSYAYVVDQGSVDLKVIDVSDPSSPALSGSIVLGSGLFSVAVQGSYAYVVDFVSDDLKVIDVSDPAAPTLSGSLAIGGFPISVAVQGSYAYVVDQGSDDLKVIDVSDPANPTISGSLAIGGSPRSVAVQGSYAYVVDLVSDDLKVIDVSDPANPTFSGSLAIGGFPISVAVQGSYAYVVDQGSVDLKVIDVSDPASPALSSSLAIGSGPSSVVVQGSYAYVVDQGSYELMVIQLGAAVGIGINGEPTAFTEADGDPGNELLTGATLNGTDLEITDAGGTTTVDLSPLNPTETDPEVGANTTNYLPKWDGSALVASSSIFEDGNGKVGIGTSTPEPDYALTIRGTQKAIGFENQSTLHAKNSSGNYEVFLYPRWDDDKMYLNYGASGFNIRSSGQNSTMYMTGDNKVGIGLTPATNRLEVNGTASKSSAGDWLANSDARLKKNIRPLDSEAVLQKMLALQGITYEWDDDQTGNERPEGTMYGFTAQNIQSVFPELVEEDNLGFLQTAYGTYDAMYVEAMRALNQKIEQQEAAIENLQSQLTEMEQLRAENSEQRAATEAMQQRLARLEAVLLSSTSGTEKTGDE